MDSISDNLSDARPQYRRATTLTDVLISMSVIIMDQQNPTLIKKCGVGKQIKEVAIAQLVDTGKYNVDQAEQIVECRLLDLAKQGLIKVSI